jgi:hypothetical protein
MARRSKSDGAVLMLPLMLATWVFFKLPFRGKVSVALAALILWISSDIYNKTVTIPQLQASERLRINILDANRTAHNAKLASLPRPCTTRNAKAINLSGCDVFGIFVGMSETGATNLAGGSGYFERAAEQSCAECSRFGSRHTKKLSFFNTEFNLVLLLVEDANAAFYRVYSVGLHFRLVDQRFVYSDSDRFDGSHKLSSTSLFDKYGAPNEQNKLLWGANLASGGLRLTYEKAELTLSDDTLKERLEKQAIVAAARVLAMQRSSRPEYKPPL